MINENKKENIDKYRPKVDVSDIFKFVVNHPGLSVFIVYATIAIAGFIHVITFYQYFGLDVIIYLEIGDILIAGIKDPMVMLMVLGSFLGIFLMWLMAYVQAPFSAWLDKKFDKGFFKFIPYLIGIGSVRAFWWTSFLMVIIYFIMFISLHSNKKSISIKRDKEHLVTVYSEITSDKMILSLLGTSINYIFLYDHEEMNTIIIPLENVAALKPIKEKDKSN